MNRLIILVTVMLWIWQGIKLHLHKKNIRHSVLTHGLYASALILNIIYEQQWIGPVLLRPYITLLQMVNKALGLG